MNQATMLSYKTTVKPDLFRVANYFRTNISGNAEVLVLKKEHLEPALKVEASQKFAFYFKFGCICLVNFEETEAYRFVKIIESIGENVDYQRLFSYIEREEVILEEGRSEADRLKIIGILATVLAKSVELKYMEDSVAGIVDQSERILNDLQHGLPNPSSRLLLRITFGILSFQIDVIHNLKILDRPKAFGDNLELRAMYNAALANHNIDKRFAAVQMKLSDLMAFISPYRKLGYSRRERSLLLVEIILIALFPLAYIMKDFIHF